MNGRQVQCVFASGAKIPIYVGTRAPTVMKLVAALADGIIYTGELSTVQPLVDAMKQFCADAGRAGDEIQVICRLPCCVDENASEAREEVKAFSQR